MNVFNAPKRAGQLLILGYQYTISPDHSWVANFFPYRVCKYDLTCSEFGYQALEKYGLLKGSWLTFKRLLRCNPWSAGGHDPVP